MEETARPRPLSEDTPLEVERVWIEMLRDRGPARRLERAVTLTSICWRASGRPSGGVVTRHPRPGSRASRTPSRSAGNRGEAQP